ncbi:NAD(P)-binding protein [Teratosphaeria destructans]|uniref:NAD(P)-binding protein n=1 Tax=Teratosphaeria destructans TaxID=418781 RepID=A0A9W7W4A1_9PEZI|nr:NAD(P)-binding protein [Teratosphaeria destructans]
MAPTSKDGPSRYIEAHKDPQGPGDARPTALQIIQDNGLLGRLTDKTFLVTGGTDGLGKETVRQLVKTGARVFFSARSPEKAEQVRNEILAEGTAGGDLERSRLEWVKIDNASLQSVREGIEDFLQRSDSLNVLIANVGIALTPHAVTVDGFEKQFAVNHLAHFLMFQLLQPLMLKSSKPDFHSRYVAVSSSAHMLSSVQIGNYNQDTKATERVDPLCSFTEDTYNPAVAYGQSKTANIWMANQIERQYGSEGLHGLSTHPGVIFTAGWAGFDEKAAAGLAQLFESDAVKASVKNVEQGAATQVMAAVDKELEGKGGLYLDDAHVADPLLEEQPFSFTGYKPWAYDPEGEVKLWRDSLAMVGLPDSSSHA